MSKISLLRGETKLVCYLCLCLRVCLCPCWFTHTCICDHGSNPRTGCFLSSRCMCVCVSVCLCLCLRACLRVCLCPRSCTHKHVYALTASDRMIETLSYIRDKCEYFCFYRNIYRYISISMPTRGLIGRSRGHHELPIVLQPINVSVVAQPQQLRRVGHAHKKL